ncbi:MAG TPA: TonB-dependent receptor [Sphingomicrobium sp.]|nr:TonB-dependent receptor [Sphingomicrobium sp.]
MYRLGVAHVAALTALISAAPAQAQQSPIDIPAQTAASSLLVLTKQVDVQILSARRDTRGVRTNAVHGVMAPQQALAKMLVGTGLQAERMNERTFVVLPLPSRPPPVSAVSARPVVPLVQPPEREIAQAAAPDTQEIIVTGIRSSLRSALRVKRAADVISDNISSEEIGQLPDVTIAEELNRLPGVNTIRDRGNASQASLRGLGPRFVLGLVNGREVASSEPSQELRWEVYPSEVLSAVQVDKTQDSSFIPGGIAGTVDIQTMKPLDHYGRTAVVRFGPTYNESGEGVSNYTPWGYRGSAGISTHLTDTIAIALAASVQKEKNGFADFRTWGWNTPESTGGHTGDLDGDGIADQTLWGLLTERKNVVQDRYALVANAGWAPTDSLTVNFDSLYSLYTIEERQFQTWYANNILGNSDNSSASIYNGPDATYVIAGGSVVAAHLPDSSPNFQSNIASYGEHHDVLATGVNVDWQRGGWDLTVDVSHSRANRRNQWRAIYLADQFGSGLDYDLRGEPSASISYATIPPWDPSIQSASVARLGNSAGPEYAADRLSAAAIDIRRDFGHSALKSFQIGGRLSDRVKMHRYFVYDLCPGSLTTGICDVNAHDIDLSPYVSIYSIPDFTAPPMVWGNWDQLWPMVYPDSGVPADSEQMLQHSHIRMGTAEAYAKLDFASNFGRVPLSGNLGVRVTRTSIRSSGFRQDAFGVISPVTVRNSFIDVLPSLNATAKLTPHQLLRFGASVAMSRPPLDALVTGFLLNPLLPGQQPTGTGGNPGLRPFKADQLDLSYEDYFHEESLFSLAAFYKHVKNYVGGGTALQTINGTDYLISTLANGNGGDVWGFESRFQSRFYFLPGFLKDFGVYANYAYVGSNIHEFAPAGDPYRIVGLAKHTAQFDTFFSKGPFEVRVGVKYHSPFTVNPSWVGTNLKQLAAETLLDASASWQLTQAVGLRFQARNLTNERARYSSDNKAQNLAADAGYQIYGRSYLMDLSFNF